MRTILIASGIILMAALSRLLPHPPNFTPLAAIALAGGVYMNKRLALVIPLAALLLSDAVLGFHRTMIFVYASFVLTGFMGIWLKSHKRPLPVFGAALMSSVLFFIVTNFGVWLMQNGVAYPNSLPGLLECYTAAIPFFRNTVLGDVVYTAVLFGVFETAEYGIRMLGKKEAVSREQTEA